ncbi:lipase, partial [Streptomyces lunaelactis]|nr:lipase [Streptomyces lunaelactis]
MKMPRFAALASALLLAAGAALFGAGQASAAADFGYVALGDSYSSGVGAGNYDSASGNCKRTTRAYPALWAAAHAPQ